MTNPTSLKCNDRLYLTKMNTAFKLGKFNEHLKTNRDFLQVVQRLHAWQTSKR